MAVAELGYHCQVLSQPRAAHAADRWRAEASPQTDGEARTDFVCLTDPIDLQIVASYAKPSLSTLLPRLTSGQWREPELDSLAQHHQALTVNKKPHMEAWQTVLFAFGGNAALLIVLGLFGKSLLEKIIAQDIKVFEAELSRKTQVEIDRLRDEMTRKIESYKGQLKKSEVFFQRELEAASVFSSLLHSLLPSYNQLNMDRTEACEEMAWHFDKFETKLNEFLSGYAAMLTDEERAILCDSIADAATGKFETTGDEVEAETCAKADEMHVKLKNLEHMLFDRVRSQSSL